MKMDTDKYTPLSQALYNYLEMYGGVSDEVDAAHDRLMDEIDKTTMILEDRK